MIGLSVAGTILARIVALVLPLYLMPTDFGIFALAVVFSGLLSMIADLGLSTGLVRTREKFEEAADTAFTLQMGVATGLLGLSVLAGWIASQVFSEPRLALPVIVLCLGLFFQALSMVPRVIANRALDFRRAAIPDTVGRSSGAVVTVVLAVIGLAYWSPVYGTLFGAAVGTAMQLAWSKWRPRLRFSAALARDMMGFGQFVVLAVFANFVAHTLDNAIVGLVLGIAPLGFYTVAYSWGVYLTSNLSSVLAPVGYPVMATIVDAPVRFKRAFAENLRYFGYAAICLSFGVFVLAPDFVLSFYGLAWAPAVLPMQILAPVGALLGYSAVCGDALYALGHSRTVFKATWGEVLLLVAVLPPATISLGLAGTSASALAGALFVSLLLARSVSRRIRFNANDWRNATSDALLAGFLSAVLVMTLSLALPTTVLWLAVEAVVFLTSYLASLQLITRGLFLRDIASVIRLVTTRRAVMRQRTESQP